MWRQRRKPETQRQPHPDPSIEVELQRIISLQRAVARKETELDQLQALTGKLRKAMQVEAGALTSNGERRKQIDRHVGRTSELEAEVVRLHDEIANRLTPMREEDRAYLYDSTKQRG